jgi:uncharacterized repeat protein (TIGR01451 family)
MGWITRTSTAGRARPRQAAKRLGLGTAAIAMVIGGLAPLASSTPANDGNPDLNTACGLNVSLVLDDSGSISSSEGDLERSAASTFANALVGTPSTLKVGVFADRGQGVASGGGLTSVLNNIVFRDPALYTAPISGAGSGGTNWDDGLEVIRRSNGGPGNLVVFITDGDPTYRNATTPDGHNDAGNQTLAGNGSSVSTDNLNNAISEANAIKAGGAHMFGIGVGLTDANSEQRLNDVTGDDELTLDGSGNPNISFGTADYTITNDFTGLGKVIKAFVRDLCAPSVNVTKNLQLANGTTVPAGASDPWNFTATVSPTPLTWQSPAGASGATASQDTDSNGGASFKWKMDSNSASVDLTESSKAGWVYNGAKCVRNLLDGSTPTVIFDDVGTNTPGASKSISELQDITVGLNEAVNCDVYNRQIRNGTIQVLKQTVPAGMPDTFDFHLKNDDVTLDTVSGIGHGQTGTFKPVTPGQGYVVTEDPKAGYTLTSSTCDDLATTTVETTPADDIAVNEGQSWKCTFVNTANPGTVTVVKDTVGADGTFDFTSNVPDLGNFSLTTVNNTASSAKITVPVGTYGVSEDDPAPWTLTGSSCTGQQSPGQFTVAPGADVVCTFTNTSPAPTIQVTKTADVSTVAEPGGPVTYTVSVTNTSVEPVTIQSITDSIEGGSDIDVTTVGAPITATTCDDLIGDSLAVSGAGATETCTFTADVTGNGGDSVHDVVTVEAMDPHEATATDTDDETVRITNVAPTLQVTKTPSVSSIAEPGGDVTYTVGIKNTSPEPVKLDGVTDVIEGAPSIDVTTVSPPVSATTCGDILESPLAAGASTSCQFTVALVVDKASLPDGDVDDTVTVTGHDDDVVSSKPSAKGVVRLSPVSASASASVDVTDTLPTITVTKTPSPTSVAETAPGDSHPVSYLVTIQNDSVEPVTIGSIKDSVEGGAPFDAQGTCAALVGTTLAAQAGTSCTFSQPVSGNAGDVVHDTVTVVASDDDKNDATDSDSAAVDITGTPSSIQVTKTASVGSVPEPGGNVTYTVDIENTSAADTITLGSITDSVSGSVPFAAAGTCPALIGATIAPGATKSCSFTLAVNGNAGDAVPDTATVTGTDDDGGPVTGSDSENVTVTGVPSSITVTKTPSVQSVPEPGGPVTYTVVITNTSAADAVTLGSITDSVSGGPASAAGGTCTPTLIGTTVQPGGQATCTFTRTVSGNAGASVPDTVVVSGTDDDDGQVSANASAVVDVTDVASSLQVTKTPSVSSLPEPGGNVTYTVDIKNTSPTDTLTLTSLTDSVESGAPAAPGGTCDALVGTSLAPGATTSCTFTMAVAGAGGDAVHDTVTVGAEDDDDHTLTTNASAVVDITEVLPAGTVSKTATPSTVPEPGGPVSFAVVVTNTGTEQAAVTALTDTFDGATVDITQVAGKITATTCATGAVLASGGTYTCAFTLQVTGNAGDVKTDHIEATLADNHQNTVTPTDDESVTVTDVLPTIAVVKDNGNASLAAPGGDVQFEVSVENTSPEAVTLDSLIDTIEGGTPFDITTVAGKVTSTTCATGGSIAPGATYSCTFTLSVSSDEAATEADVVTAKASDDEDNVASGSDDAVTSVTASADLAIDKTIAGDELKGGQSGTYLLEVTNNGPSTAAQPVVVDHLPAELTATAASGDGWACEISGQVVTCTRDSLAPGAVSTISVAVDVPVSTIGEDVTNVADVSATTPDPDDSNNHDEITTQPVEVAPEQVTSTTSTTTTPTATTQPTDVAPGTLPRTGSDTRGPVVLALVLLAAGAALLGGRRWQLTRRTHA